MKNRQLAILLALLKKHKTTYGQLAAEFEVSRKTIERDIDFLSSLGIPVYCTQGVGGGVYLPANYKFSSSFFSPENIHDIVFAFKILDSFALQPKTHEILAKLNLIAPQLTALFEDDAANYLTVDLITEKVNLDSQICQAIDTCLDLEVLAIINQTCTVAPIGYVLKNEGLYLYCFAQDYQLVKISSIQTITVTKQEFERNFLSYEEYKKSITVKQDNICHV